MKGGDFMENNLQKLINILLELRIESIKASKEDTNSIMEKYNIMFLGSKFNIIYSFELIDLFKNYFNFDISKDELYSLIPIACKSLNMKFEELVDNKGFKHFSISLWE